MHVVVADPQRSCAHDIRDRLLESGRSLRVDIVADLVAAYDIAEHRVPDLFFVNTALARLAEFEVLQFLFRALAIRCVLHQSGGQSDASIGHVGKRAGLRVVHTDQVCAVLREASVGSSTCDRRPSSAQPDARGAEFDDGVILLGASTGGVEALIEVLASFPKNCPPTFLVQHTSARFTAGLAQLLDSHVTPKVVEADPIGRPAPGQIHVAPGGDRHLHLRPGTPLRMRLAASHTGQAYCPSVDELFHSAVPYGQNVSAALLTGMGRDGAQGLLALRRAWARTFIQDEQTSVVYGMPRAAFELGAADRTLPVGDIGPAILASRRRWT